MKVEHLLGIHKTSHAGRQQRQNLLAPIGIGVSFRYVAQPNQPVDDGHDRGPIYLQPLCNIGLPDARVVFDQPEHRDLCLSQTQRLENLREMAVRNALSKAQTETQDVVEFASRSSVGRISLARQIICKGQHSACIMSNMPRRHKRIMFTDR